VKLSYDWDWLGAEEDFKHALRLNPKYPTAHQWYASYLMQMGKFDRAREEIQEAHNLDPLSPIISSNAGSVFYYMITNTTTRFAKYKLTLQSDPEFWVGAPLPALAHVQKECLMTQSLTCDQLIKAPPTGPVPDEIVAARDVKRLRSLGFAYAMAGKTQ
jgi:tetratricopeptide (TPR) repeat protein